MRLRSWLALLLAIVVLAACGRTVIVINVDILSFIPEENRAFGPAVLHGLVIGPHAADGSADLAGLVGITSGEVAVTLEVSPDLDTVIGMAVFVAPGGVLNPLDPQYEIGSSGTVSATAGTPAELAVVLALGPDQLAMITSGSVQVSITLEASPATTGSGEITLLRLTVRRDSAAG